MGLVKEFWIFRIFKNEEKFYGLKLKVTRYGIYISLGKLGLLFQLDIKGRLQGEGYGCY